MGEREDLWSDVELEACVDAYIGMLGKMARNERFVKRAVITELLSGPLSGRTRGAVEFRFQNISAIRAERGLAWVKGFPPHANVGPRNKQKLSKLLNGRSALDGEYEGTSYAFDGISGIRITGPETRLKKLGVTAEVTSDQSEFDERVRELRKRGGRANRLGRIPEGQDRPRRTPVTVQVFYRDPAVKAWVLENAAGCCEGCHSGAPFFDDYNQAFLEAHHLQTLADGGADTIWNTVALCPNCHRRMHYGNDRREFTIRLLANLKRPVKQGKSNARG